MSLSKRLFKHITLIVSILCFAVDASAAEPKTSNVKLLRGEKWWGVELGMTPRSIEIKQGAQQTVTTSILLSSKGRYLWSETPMTVGVEGAELKVVGDGVKVQKGGRTLRDAYLVCRHKHFPPQIKERPTDIYALPVVETELELGYMQSAEAVIEYAQRLNQMGINQAIMVLTDGWSSMDGSLDFDRNIYPDARATIDQLHKMGFRVMLNISPYCSMSGRGAYRAHKENTLLRDAHNKPIVATQYEQIPYYVYDVCNPAVYDHFQQRLQALVADYGVDGFRFDADELLQSAPSGEYLTKWESLGAEFDMVEYATSLTSHYVPSRIEYAAESDDNYVGAMLALGLTGVSVPYVAPSLEAELEECDNRELLGLLQQELLMPIARVPFAPWRITDPELYEEYLRDLELRGKIGEHLRKVASEGNKTVEPMVRHLEYLFPGGGFADCTDQYMLGDDYLVAPIFEGTKRTVRLPRGAWYDITGKRYRGPVVLKFDATDGRICCFERREIEKK